MSLLAVDLDTMLAVVLDTIMYFDEYYYIVDERKIQDVNPRKKCSTPPLQLQLQPLKISYLNIET